MNNAPLSNTVTAPLAGRVPKGFRKIKGGVLVAPIRGPAPAPPPGYERDVNDEYVFHIILDPCAFRSLRKRASACCPGGELLFCDRDKKFIRRDTCKACQA